MSNHTLLVLTNPVVGKEKEYNDWYSNTHIQDIVAIPGFVSAQRFKLSDAQMADAGPYKYLAIYEVEGDPAAALDALKAATPNIEMSDALNTALGAHMFSAITEVVTE
ncbi:MAG: hypothetical protein KUG79_16270 [Pseudomonadales bacterium]|nr:hypothetical protein [Pseudomonadales bacterium]